MPKFLPSLLDMKLGVRMLFKYPGLSIIGGIGMAVAIAVVAGFSSLLVQFVYPTLPIDEGHRLVGLENWDTVANNEERQAVHDFVTWRAEMKTVVEISAFRNAPRNMAVAEGPTEPITVAEMTATGLRTARVAPLFGRTLAESDEQPGAPDVAVIGYDVWQSRFAADPRVVGRVVRFDGTPYTIVGVMPAGFAFPMNHQYWTPLRLDAAAFPRGEGPAIFIFGRLAPGATRAQAQAELTALGARAAAAFPTTHAQLRAQVLPYTYPLTDFQDAALWEVALQLLTVTLLVVVVAANVAVLIYARTSARQREIAVRAAIGAGRARVIAQLFGEALVLAAVAGAGGILLAQFGLTYAFGILEQETVTLPFWFKRGLSTELVTATCLLTLATAAIVGIVPAIQVTGRGVASGLRQLSSGFTLRLGGTWTLLIVGQVAVATLALPAAFANGWTWIARGMRLPAFAADEFMAAPVLMRNSRPGAVQELVDVLGQEPNIDGVTFAQRVPNSEVRGFIEIEGGPGPGVSSPAEIRTGRVDVGFFSVFDTPVLAGRSFADTDTRGGGNPIVVNRRFVDRVFNGAHPLGRRVRYVRSDRESDVTPPDLSTWHEIVGVVADLHSNPMEARLSDSIIYHPMALPEAGGVMLFARVRSGAPVEMTNRLRELAGAIDPTLQIPYLRTVADFDRQEQIAIRLVSIVIALITVSVLLLSAAGVYAMMAFTVSQRRREIGIRAALGAAPGQVLRGIFARATRQLGAGLLVGIAAVSLLDVAGGGQMLAGRALIFVPAVALMMITAGLLAAMGPARRGLRVDATEALKSE